MKRLLLFILILHTVIFAAQMTPEMLVSYTSISVPQISSDGRWVACFKNNPAEANDGKDRGFKEIWLYNLETAENRLFSGQKEKPGNFAWSADGNSIFFLAKIDSIGKSTQVFRRNIGEHNLQPITNYSENIAGFKIDNSGSQIAFLSAKAKSTQEIASEKNGEDWIIDELDFRYQYLFLQNMVDTTAIKISPNSLHIFDMIWDASGSSLFIQAAKNGSSDAGYMDKKIYGYPPQCGRINRDGSGFQQLCQHNGKLSEMAVSPDGKWLAYIGAVDRSDPVGGSLFIVDLKTGKKRDLTENFMGIHHDVAGTAGRIKWQDEKTLLLLADTFNHTSLFSINVNTQEWNTIREKGEILSDFDNVPGKDQFVFTANNFNHPNELFRGNLNSGKTERLTFSNQQLDSIDWIVPENFIWQARDGLEIQGVLYKPRNFKPDGSAPLVVIAHGGPEDCQQSGWNNFYHSWPQILAEKGCVVLLPNYRGSTGRGVAFAKADQADMMGAEFNDVLNGIDALIAQKWVDPKKVGITGGSYGGYMTAWAATRHSERFAAAVMFKGISDQVSKIGTTDTPQENLLVHWASDLYADHFQLAWDRSPLKYVDNHRTPLLIVHGEKDKRVPVGQAIELFRALKHKNQAPVKMLVFPGAGHALYTRAHQLHFAQEALAWFDKYLIN